MPGDHPWLECHGLSIAIVIVPTDSTSHCKLESSGNNLYTSVCFLFLFLDEVYSSLLMSSIIKSMYKLTAGLKTVWSFQQCVFLNRPACDKSILHRRLSD